MIRSIIMMALALFGGVVPAAAAPLNVSGAWAWTVVARGGVTLCNVVSVTQSGTTIESGFGSGTIDLITGAFMIPGAGSANTWEGVATSNTMSGSFYGGFGGPGTFSAQRTCDPAVANSCDDGDGCTTESCTGGAACAPNTCVETRLADCCDEAVDCDDGNSCTTDACESQSCRYAGRPDGAPCGDANLCTQVDTCLSAWCVGSAPIVCTASDACHLAGVCEPSTGLCSAPPGPDGDGDGSCDAIDNCPGSPNPGQGDLDGDGIGDLCDADADGDGVVDATENNACLGSAINAPVTAIGCSLVQVCPCSAALGRRRWNSRGEYRRCVKEAASELVTDGRLTSLARRDAIRAARAASCGGE